MRKDLIKEMIDSALDGRGITRQQALELEFFSHEDLDYLFEGTNRLRDRFKGDDVKICSIVNAKAGKCEEDCGFCAQSSQFKTDSPEYGLLDVDKIVEAAKEAEAFGSNEFSIVTSGTALNRRDELDKVIEDLKTALNGGDRVNLFPALGDAWFRLLAAENGLLSLVQDMFDTALIFTNAFIQWQSLPARDAKHIFNAIFYQ